MTRVKLQKIDTFSELEYESFRKMVSPEKLERADRYKQKNDYKRSLLADITARRMMEQETGIEAQDLDIRIDEFGKPYVNNVSNIFFNVSHAGDFVACIISDNPCGIDIERAERKADIDIAKRFFAAEEYNFLMSLEEGKRAGTFFEMWTAKEAYTKYLGKGIVMGLDTFVLRKTDSGFDVFDDGVLRNKVVVLDIEGKYKLSYVCEDDDIVNIENG